jgi:hypothetical protein
MNSIPKTKKLALTGIFAIFDKRRGLRRNLVRVSTDTGRKRNWICSIIDKDR